MALRKIKTEVVHGHAIKVCSCADCAAIRKGKNPVPYKAPDRNIGGPFPTIGFPTLTFTAKGMKGRYGYVSVSEFQTTFCWIPAK